MPTAPHKRCSYPRCGNKATVGARCEQHKHQRFYNRVNSGLRGYDHAWHKVRKIKIRHDPCCQICEQHNVDTIATVVHHIKEIETHPELRLVMSNLMSLCHDCHEALHGRLTVVGCDVNGIPLNLSHEWNK